MISLGQEHHLGQKAFILLLIRNMAPAVGLLIIATTVIILSDFIVQGIVQSLHMSGQLLASSEENVTKIFVHVLIGLYIFDLFLFMAGYIISKLQYIYYTFTLEEFDLRLKKGIFNIEIVSIPYRQIQDVNINRSLFYRLIGVSRIIIESAGHEDSKEQSETQILLEPIDKEMAEEIRQLLQRRIGVQVIEHEREADADMKELGGTIVK